MCYFERAYVSSERTTQARGDQFVADYAHGGCRADGLQRV